MYYRHWEAPYQLMGRVGLLWKDLEIIFKLSVIQRLLPDCCFMAHLIQKQNKKIIISGNWIQALGSFTALTDEFFDNTEEGRAENIIGNLLQGIGNALQALSGVQVLYGNSINQGQLGVAGSWIQTAGSVITLIGEFLEESEEIRLGISE